MENFNVGEIIWAKIRGYPWWPAIITGTKDDSKEKIYRVSFIGDKTFANLPKKFLRKFEKEFKNHCNTKQKKLSESIKEAQKMFSNKTMKGNYIKSRNKSEQDNIEDDEDYDNNFDDEEENDNNSYNVNSSNHNSNNSNSSNNEDNDDDSHNNRQQNQNNNTNTNNEMSRRKRNRTPIQIKQRKTNTNSLSLGNGDKKKQKTNVSSLLTLKSLEGMELIKKIIYYLLYISNLVQKKEYEQITTQEQECLIKVLEFLRDYKMTDPIEFLKKTNIGQLIKYIHDNLPEGNIKQFVHIVYKNLEEQVLSQLFQKNK